MVSAIIPAYNEEGTVADVVRAALRHPSVREVIVVDDASSDKTSEAARKSGAKVIVLRENSGKAAAMDAGVRASSSGVILFMDADVSGYSPEKISRIIGPVERGEKEMYVALRARRIFWLNKFLRFFPILGGERALTKSLWDSVPHDRKRGFEIEIALNYFAKQTRKGMGFEIVYGIRHFIKERKYGFWTGLWRRLAMCYEVARVSFLLYIAAPVRHLFSLAKQGRHGV